MRRHRTTVRQRQRGAALLTAMIIVTLIVTLSASMVWQQWRAVQVEVAERSRAQSAWILAGALDWARLILREDARSGTPTALTSPWAVPLAEARLSSFLAADKNNNTDEDGPDAFLSGAISDAQARYNLANLINNEGKIIDDQAETLKRLCQAIGLPADVATRIAAGLRDAAATTAATTAGDAGNAAPLLPRNVAQLSWFGLDAATIAALEPYVVLLPRTTLVNVNTASREVLAAVVKDLDLASAERIVQARQRVAFKDASAVQELVPTVDLAALQKVIAAKSDFFEVRGRLRLTDRVLEERSLVERLSDGRVAVLQSDKVASREGAGP